MARHLARMSFVLLAIATVSVQNALANTDREQSDPVGLRVMGRHLVDGAGVPVVFHGVNISGSEFACAQGGSAGNHGWSIFGGQPVDTAGTIEAIKSWHANAVRVPLNEDCWLGISGINPAFGGTSYRDAIRSFVHHLVSAGLFVIVDLHWSAPGDALALSQQPMADLDHAPAFWSQIANEFRDNSNVVFDLYNEPFLYAGYFEHSGEDAWSCWLTGCGLNKYLTGGQPYTQNHRWQTAGMQQLVDAVRAAGASNVVIASGLDWANDDSGWLAHQPHDPTGNLVAGWHEYHGESCARVDCWSQTIVPVTQKVPVVVGETGDVTGAGCTLKNLPTFLPWADNHGISYLAWTFNPWRDTHDVLIADWKGTPSPCEGEYYAAHLAALAAAPGSTSSGPEAANPHGSSASNDINATRTLILAVFFLGVALFGAGVLLATNPFNMMSAAGQNRFVIGIGIAILGAASCVTAATFLA